ncbi:hypothetical protein CHUAL_004596 [Chamberlinius hualienensis]
MAAAVFTAVAQRYFRILTVVFIFGLALIIFETSWTDKDNPSLIYSNDSDELDFFYYKLNGSNRSSDTPTKLKKILFWNSFFSSRDFYFGLGVKPFIQQCTPQVGFIFQPCTTTVDRSQLISSDVIIFHVRNIDFNDMPTQRSSNQLWIFFLMESPGYTNVADVNKRQLDGIFNWTMTYRQDSDVFNGYFKTLKKPIPVSIGDEALLELVKPSERRLVAWLVSNCATFSKREAYVSKLKQFIPVDVYGSCGQRCPGNTPDECFEFVFSKYKFVLAFENSFCRDYVTEKLSKALKGGSVPVVYGNANYSAIAPPNSVINVKDFNSPKHLADYILQLNASDELYLKYFRWRQQYELTEPKPFCELCRKIHTTDVISKPKIYNDMQTWWFVNGSCESAIT